MVKSGLRTGLLRSHSNRGEWALDIGDWCTRSYCRKELTQTHTLGVKREKTSRMGGTRAGAFRGEEAGQLRPGTWVWMAMAYGISAPGQGLWLRTWERWQPRLSGFSDTKRTNPYVHHRLCPPKIITGPAWAPSQDGYIMGPRLSATWSSFSRVFSAHVLV